MKQLKRNILFSIITLSVSYALAEDNTSLSPINADSATIKTENAQKLQNELDYLKKNPKELEKVFLVLITNKDAEKIKLLLPIYEQYPNRDMSLIDWGNAIILEKQSKHKEAVKLYRKLNSALPNVKTLRLHMANALFQDKQYQAARSEFEKLRSEKDGVVSTEVINSYINAIKKKDGWSFDASATLINDSNLNGVPKKGTTLQLPNGSSFTADKEPETGKGFSYSLSAGRKFPLKNNFSGTVQGSIDGKYLFNNKKYNDLSITLTPGVNYEDAKKSLSVNPYVSKRFYASAKKENTNLSSYATSYGLNVSGSYWINPKWNFNSSVSVGKEKYIEKYKFRDAKSISFSNSVSYLPSQTTSFYAGIDVSNRTTDFDEDSFLSKGVRAGWNQAWGKGFSTQLGGGVSQKNHKGVNFFGIKNKDTKYNFKASVWNRNVHFLDITPRLIYRYDNTKSNNKLNEYDEHNVMLEFSKDF